MFSGMAAGSLCAILAFVYWSYLLLPFPDCGIQTGPCGVPLGLYSARVPEGAARPLPAVLYLHGTKGSGEAFIARTQLINDALRRKWAVIAPTGLGMRYASGFFSGWSLDQSPGPERDELGFLEQVLADAERRFGIDRQKVLIVGYSRGGFLTWELACKAPEIATAFAPVSALYWGQMPETCAAGKPILHLHGQRDRGVPLTGQRHANGTTVMTPAAEVIEVFLAANGCAPGGERKSALPGGGTRTDWLGCPDDGPLSQVLLPGGHRFNRKRWSLVLDWFEDRIGG